MRITSAFKQWIRFQPFMPAGPSRGYSRNQMSDENEKVLGSQT